MSIDKFLNSSFWQHFTALKALTLMFIAICAVFYFKGEIIVKAWVGHDVAKYGSVTKAYLIDTLNTQENLWQDSVMKTRRYYWQKLHEKNNTIDSLEDFIKLNSN